MNDTYGARVLTSFLVRFFYLQQRAEVAAVADADAVAPARMNQAAVIMIPITHTNTLTHHAAAEDAAADVRLEDPAAVDAAAAAAE